MKRLKNGAGQCLYFMQLFLHYILFGENVIAYVIVPLYSVCLNLNHEKKKKKIVTKMERLKRWWYL